LTRELGICDHVRFLGKSKSIEKLLAISDLFILPSETESFGLAALEAMAARVPVISTNTGGLPEVNMQGETGYLSDVGDIVNMAKDALKVLIDEPTLEAFKERAFTRAQEFSIQRILPKYEAIYEKLYLKSKG
jgi:glycosyltransferase involved in cell wall biosynthesis